MNRILELKNKIELISERLIRINYNLNFYQDSLDFVNNDLINYTGCFDLYNYYRKHIKEYTNQIIRLRSVIDEEYLDFHEIESDYIYSNQLNNIILDNEILQYQENPDGMNNKQIILYNKAKQATLEYNQENPGGLINSSQFATKQDRIQTSQLNNLIALGTIGFSELDDQIQILTHTIKELHLEAKAEKQIVLSESSDTSFRL